MSGWPTPSLQWRRNGVAIDGAWRAEEDLVANAVISAVGMLNRPSLPDIEGLDRFGGPCFHSARWNHDYDLRGKRVAVIGTGATGIQAITEIAKTAGHLTVFQRTAQWSAPLHNSKVTAEEMAESRVDRAGGVVHGDCLLGSESGLGVDGLGHRVTAPCRGRWRGCR